MTNNSINVSNTLLSRRRPRPGAVRRLEPRRSRTCDQQLLVHADPDVGRRQPDAHRTSSFLANAITAIGLQGEDGRRQLGDLQRTLGGYTNITYYLMNGALHDAERHDADRSTRASSSRTSSNGGGISLDGALVADGTARTPIVFTSALRRPLRQPGRHERRRRHHDARARATGRTSTSPARRTTRPASSTTAAITYGVVGAVRRLRRRTCGSRARRPRITNSFIFKGQYGIRVDGDGAPIIARRHVRQPQLTRRS